MDRLNLQAEERVVFGKKVKKLRSAGKLPAHVFGNGVATEHISVRLTDFLKTFKQAGETGLIDLKIGLEKVRPVMVREVQYDPVSEQLLHIDFYQVNLSQQVRVPVPLVLTGEEPGSVKLGEAIVLQTLNQVEVEALPTDLVDKIEVDITPLQNINDSITVAQLSYDSSKLTVHADGEEIVVKLAPAVSQETKELLEEQAAEAVAAEAAEEGVEAPKEGEKEAQEAVAGEGAKQPSEGDKPQEEEQKES